MMLPVREPEPLAQFPSMRYKPMPKIPGRFGDDKDAYEQEHENF